MNRNEAGRIFKRREYQNRYYAIPEHKAKRNEQNRLRRQREENKLWMKRYLKNYTKVVKREVFTHYGNGKCACVKCGFDDIRALSIDHINGRGHAHRAKMGLKGIRFYQWLKKNGYPEGYQVLCMNCQWIKRDENREYNLSGGGWFNAKN